MKVKKNPINQKEPTLNEGLAEFYGAMIGDGCLSKYLSNYDGRIKYCILITGHTHDEPYYREILQPIFLNEFGIKGCIRFKKKDNVTRFETLSRRIFYFFENLGFPVGIKGNIGIPDEIFDDSLLSTACVRGIFDTDGSIYNRYSRRYANHSKKYFYKNVEFKMNSYKLITQIQTILNRIGIKTSAIRKNKDAVVLTIHDQNSVRKFFEIVNPHNKYHTERFLN